MPIRPMVHSRALRASVAPLPRDWNRRAGRPRLTWLRTVESDLAPFNIWASNRLPPSAESTGMEQARRNGNVQLWTSHMIMMMMMRHERTDGVTYSPETECLQRLITGGGIKLFVSKIISNLDQLRREDNSPLPFAPVRTLMTMPYSSESNRFETFFRDWRSTNSAFSRRLRLLACYIWSR